MICLNSGHPDFTPTEHQTETLNAFLTSPYKGMLLYHKLGSGKTCTAIMIADALLSLKRINRVFIFTPGSLRQGWITEYCNVCGKDTKDLGKDYTFVTYNYNIKDIPDLNDSLVIIDEVHNLINGVKNMTKTPTHIYNTILNAKCRVLALSGTPIFNFVYEFALLGNMLKPGGDFPELRYNNQIVADEFLTLFQEDDLGNLTPMNPVSMKKRLSGIISYFPGSGDEFTPITENQPPIAIQMSYDQEIAYWTDYVLEKKFAIPPSKKLMQENSDLYALLKRLEIMAKKNILTRRVSNFYYPPIVIGKNAEGQDLTIREVKDVSVERGGWVKKSYFENREFWTTFSPKFAAFFTVLTAYINEKHILFTFFKEKAGVVLLHTLLSMCGIKSAIFTGNMDDAQRKSVLARFNSKDNLRGERIRILLVTEAGAEGISVVTTRHLHVLESSPRVNKTIQSIGRAVRFKSHMLLPPEERTVKVWRYWSVSSPHPITITTTYKNPEGVEKEVTETITDKKTIDEILYERGVKTQQRIESFLRLLQDNSITKWKK